MSSVCSPKQDYKSEDILLPLQLTQFLSCEFCSLETKISMSSLL